MTTQRQEVTPRNLPPIIWQDARVITTEMLAKVYGATVKKLQDNFRNNKGRFAVGKHYHQLSGDALAEFKSDRPEIIGSVVGARARSLILWTERGAMRHAKMLETDKAWDVFETLEDCYFAARDRQSREASLSTVRDRMQLYYFTVDTVLRHRLLFSRVYLLINLFAGSRRFKDMTKAQATEVAEFCDRFAIQQDTRADWQRIVNNQERLYGKPKQLDMVQRLLIS